MPPRGTEQGCSRDLLAKFRWCVMSGCVETFSKQCPLQPCLYYTPQVMCEKVCAQLAFHHLFSNISQLFTRDYCSWFNLLVMLILIFHRGSRIWNGVADLTSYSLGIRVRNLVQGVIWWANTHQALCFFWLVCCNFFCGRLINFPEDYPNFQSLKVWVVIKHLIWWGFVDVLLDYWQLGEMLPSSAQLPLWRFMLRKLVYI